MVKKVNAELLREVVQEMTAFRHVLHRNPEPAYQEHETAAMIVKRLSRISGMQIRQGIGETGIVAVLAGAKSGPCIALRADMDCLRMEEKNTFAHASCRPGFMHGCGHDGHVACLLGAACILGEMQDDLSGPVKFVFQPAEENLGGARYLVQEVCATAPLPVAIFALHGSPTVPVGTVAGRKGPMMAASRYFTITLKGHGTHAAMPQQGDDLVHIASQIVCAAHTIVARNVSPLEASIISIPSFQGGSAPNVMAESVTLEGTLRALSNETRAFLEQRLADIVEYVGKAHGVVAEIVYERGYPLVTNNPAWFDYFCSCARDTAEIIAVDENYLPSMGAEDFAFYLEQLPGVFFWLGLLEEGQNPAPLHNPCFDFNDKALISGISLHCQLALAAGNIPVGCKE